MKKRRKATRDFVFSGRGAQEEGGGGVLIGGTAKDVGNTLKECERKRRGGNRPHHFDRRRSRAKKTSADHLYGAGAKRTTAN